MIATNKGELIKSIYSSYKKVRKEFEEINKDTVLEKTLEWHIKGKNMSIHNLLSYLVGWWELMIKRDEVFINEKRIPDLPDTWYHMNDWWGLAEKFYNDYEDYKFENLLEKFDKVVSNIIEMLENKNNEEIYGINWYVTKSSNKWYTFWRLVSLNTSSPYNNAYWRIKKMKKIII